MADAHGVSYPPDFLDGLPRRPASSVYLLPPKAFEQLHLSHIISHPPDHILFPFLHGLEGDNDAQNAFFAAAPNAHETHLCTDTLNPRVKVPKYRGLVCVVCEEDLEANGDIVSLRILRRKNTQSLDSIPSPSTSSMCSSGSDSYDDEDDDEDDDDYDIEEDYSNREQSHMQVDVASPHEPGIQLVRGESMAMSFIDEHMKDKPPQIPDNQTHMHPVNHRYIPSITPIPVSSSTSSTDTSASSAASFSFDDSISPSDQTSLSSCPPGSPNPNVMTDAQAPGTDVAKHEAAATRTQLPSSHTKPCDPTAPPLLTCTFRPKELLRRVKPPQHGDWDWEFVPTKVPEGISLRNFGIQVPIYATLSDIVVYSPKGASPAAIALAQRFARAIGNKRQERLKSLGLLSTGGDKLSYELLDYHVFVLDACEDDMRKELPHLMMRICGEPVSGGLFGARTVDIGAHTDGPDGHIVELGALETMERERRSDLAEVSDVDMDVDVSLHRERTEYKEVANTVDFAQREKEEMRDLTKASEIISLFPSSSNSSTDSPAWKIREEGILQNQQRHRSHSSASSHPYRATRPAHLQFLPQVQPPTATQHNFTFSPPATNIDFSSTSSYFDPQVGQVFLGNSGDVPMVMEAAAPPPPAHHHADDDDPFDFHTTNDPGKGLGYDICIECHDLSTFPSAAHLRAAEDHLGMLDLMWAERCERQLQERYQRGEELCEEEIPPRPPPHANAVIHLTLPSSPSNTQATVSSLMPVVRFLEKWLKPVVPPLSAVAKPPRIPNPPVVVSNTQNASCTRRWSSVSSLIPSFVPFGSFTAPSKPVNNFISPRNRSFTAPTPTPIPPPYKPKPRPTRPLKILIYSSDGYTESSVPALCLLMAVKGLTLPEAYLELQVAKRRSFFVYSADLGILRRMEARLREEKERINSPSSHGWGTNGCLRSVLGGPARSPAKSTSLGPEYPQLSSSNPVHVQPHHHHQLQIPSQQQTLQEDVGLVPSQELSRPSPIGGYHDIPSQNEITNVKGRPRANTCPWSPSFFGGDHQAWFNDPRFDGSFPSRVLPFLYLGNLNHASNAYMLHALGITHVVSVGECALVPPGNVTGSFGGGYMRTDSPQPGPSAQSTAGKGPGLHGSLWIEEREGRIKVLDIKGVCDDGIDTLEPQLEPICEWIDKARQEGGQVLVHCRVGVSRSATVTIAYVMKHLNLPLVDAYLIVRSRRLSVLIQPNMRLLYNLCGWEIKLAKERAKGDENRLKRELSRTLNWPYLAKEVHALNEKYLH